MAGAGGGPTGTATTASAQLPSWMSGTGAKPVTGGVLANEQALANTQQAAAAANTDTTGGTLAAQPPSTFSLATPQALGATPGETGGTSLTGAPSWMNDFMKSGMDLNSYWQLQSGYHPQEQPAAPAAATPAAASPAATAPAAAAPAAAAPAQDTYAGRNNPLAEGWGWAGPGSANPNAPKVANMDMQKLAAMPDWAIRGMLSGDWNAMNGAVGLMTNWQPGQPIPTDWQKGAPKDFYDYAKWRLGTAGLYGPSTRPFDPQEQYRYNQSQANANWGPGG